MNRRIVTPWLLLLVLAPVSLGAAEGDVAGSADYPQIGRFDGSVITSYDVKDFDEYTLPTGRARGKEFESVVDLEGKVTRISYRREPGASVLEVAKNFEIKLKDAGFEILFTCKAKACGEGAFRYAIETINEPKMVIDSWQYRYIAAKKAGQDGETYASILVSTNNKKIYTQVFAVEIAAMAFRMVDAEQMASNILETGRIALYGIYFDTDKTDIKPESKPTLDEIAALLANNRQLKLIVVGHTDNQGAFDYNMTLSKRRAQAVVEELVKSYDVSKDRLMAEGVGYLAPMATNTTEDGRGQNRRVELVEQ